MGKKVSKVQDSNGVDFVHVGENNREWRIKLANSLPEFMEIFHLRYTVYKDTGYLSDDDIQSREAHSKLMRFISKSGLDEKYGFAYEVDDYDRFDNYCQNDFNSPECLTKHIVALEETANGEIPFDGKRYSLVGYMRVLLDDHGTCQNPIGFTPDSSIDMSRIRNKARRKNRVLHESGRLVKKNGTHSSMINGLTKAMVNCTLYGSIYSPDSIMSVRPNLAKYYGGLGSKKISDVFYNKELDEDHVLLHIDLVKAKYVLRLANHAIAKPIVKSFTRELMHLFIQYRD